MTRSRSTWEVLTSRSTQVCLQTGSGRFWACSNLAAPYQPLVPGRNLWTCIHILECKSIIMIPPAFCPASSISSTVEALSA